MNLWFLFFEVGVWEQGWDDISLSPPPKLEKGSDETFVVYGAYSFQWRNVSLLSRNEEFQEEMWRTSIAIVEKYLSPHILEQYGHSHIAGPTDGASPTLEGESKKNFPSSVDGPEQSHEEQQVLRHENKREKN